MKLIQIADKKKLNNFVSLQVGQIGGQFLQSWEWGELQEKLKEKILRIGVEAGGELAAVATLIKRKLPLGRSYFYSPKGPIGNFQLSIFSATAGPRQGGGNFQLVFDFLFSEIKKVAKSEKVIFFRFEPLTEIRHSTFNIRHSLDVQPSKTLILDLTKTEDELIKTMHEKTRYNIRLAEKKGVKIIEAGKNRFEDFWNLLDQTSGRDKFQLHRRDYYKAMLGITNEADPEGLRACRPSGSAMFIKLFFAEYQGKPIAAGIFSFFGNAATYLHGGSADEYRNVMAPYLLQWHIIKLAKNLGFRCYDFYGIDEKKWPGVTRFKKGFGGFEKNYPGTFDLVFDKGWYSIYRMVRKIRRNI